jgi:hypothetical protein
MSDDNLLANDNEPPSRLDNLVAVTIEDFVMWAEDDVEEGEEPVAAGPALIELAAAAVADVVFAHKMGPRVVMKMVASRVSARCMAEVERSDALNKRNLVLVKNTSTKEPSE